MEKRLNQLTQAEYQEGAVNTLENAESLFKIAELASKEHFYGNAISLLIISSEELVKAFVLRSKALNPQVQIPGIETFFYKHTIKHNLFLQLISNLIGNEIESSFSKEIELDGVKLNKGAIIVVSIIAIILSNIEELKKVGSLEEVRQKGIYVSYKNKTGEWGFPNKEYSQTEWVKIYPIYKEVISFFRNEIFKTSFTESELVAFLESIKLKSVKVKLGKNKK